MPRRTCSMLLAALAVAGLPFAWAAGPIDHLLSLAATHQDETVRRSAVNGLVSLRWQPKSPEDWQRLVAIRSLSFPLVDALLAAPEEAVQTRTVVALVEIVLAAPEARAAVLERLAQAGVEGRPPTIVEAAAKALLTIRWPASDDEAGTVLLASPPPWPLIDQLIAARSAAASPAVAKALKELAEKPETASDAKARLAKLITLPAGPPKEPEPPPKEVVVPPKEEPPPPPEPKQAEPALPKDLASPDWRPSKGEDWAQVTGLGPRAVPLLDRLLSDASIEVKLGAVHALGAIAWAHDEARPPALARLVQLATDGQREDAVRQAAQDGFLRLKGPATEDERRPVAAAGKAAIPLLDGLLGDAAPDIRTRALACLMLLVKADPKGRADTVERLVRVGRADADPGVRKIAAVALVALKWPADDREFVQAMRGDDPPWPLVGEMFETADEALVERLSDLVLVMVRADERARGAALDLLPRVVRRAALPSARRQAADLIERFTQSDDPAWAGKALTALVALAADDPTLRGRTIARLLGVATTHADARVREAAVAGLARLRWEPLSDTERRKIAALGSPGIPLADALLRSPEPRTRLAALRILADMAERNQGTHEEIEPILLRAALGDRELAAVEAATKALRTLGWPRGDRHWADLVGTGEMATRPLHALVEDKDVEVRGRAVTALAQVAGASADARAYAVARLAQLGRLERDASVREAIVAGLRRLRWPETDEDWKRLDDMGAGALCLLGRLARGDDAALREKALVRARESAPSLIAAAERQGDYVALLDGLELRWTAAFLSRQAKLLPLVEQGQLDEASVLFKMALADCEETEKRVHTLVAEAQAAPTAGIENKWRALRQCLESDALARFRQAWPLTIAAWHDTLKTRSAEADAWDATWRAIYLARNPSAKAVLLDDYLRRSPQSFYAQFAWKWKDIVARLLRTPAPAKP
ncbi:MAG: hypothetical protein FJ290_16720 [Planctomycetes bacterium]|nr:hypothetical protein [Planctomycetota bacterium]